MKEDISETIMCGLSSIGAVLWLPYTAFHFNAVNYLFGQVPSIELGVYFLIGLSGVYILYKLLKG